MSHVSEAIRSHHQELMKTLTAQVAALVESRPETDPPALARFLQDELLPHAAGEEQHLYPMVDSLVKAHGQATATMSVDHEFIEGYIRQIGEAVQTWRGAGQEQRATSLGRLQRLALQLEAVLQVHLEKEERVYLPLFEQYLADEEQQRALDGMHEAYEPQGQSADPTVLDVRNVPPPQRHPLIFGTFEGLAPGQGFVLLNDHDPKPLYYQFQAERAGRFTWDYLEQGPALWRVRIGRSVS